MDKGSCFTDEVSKRPVGALGVYRVTVVVSEQRSFV